MNASRLTSFDCLVHLRVWLINIKTCCMGLERTDLMLDAEYYGQARVSRACPTTLPTMPPWKDDRVIGQRTFRDREINSQHSRHGQSSTDWRDDARSLGAHHFPRFFEIPISLTSIC